MYLCIHLQGHLLFANVKPHKPNPDSTVKADSKRRCLSRAYSDIVLKVRDQDYQGKGGKACYSRACSFIFSNLSLMVRLQDNLFHIHTLLAIDRQPDDTYRNPFICVPPVQQGLVKCHMLLCSLAFWTCIADII